MVTHYLRAWRERKVMTQDVLAAKAGTFPSVISRFESGGRGISLEMAVRLCRTLDISLTQLLEHPDKPKSVTIELDGGGLNREQLAEFTRSAEAMAKGYSGR
jgi:transcriptional regulator with XRE-family HTH domain